jgi:hypothetical protein
MKQNKNALFSLFSFFTKFKKGVSCQPYSAVVEERIGIEYHVSDYKILKSIGVLISNTGIEVSEYRISNTKKSIECPALVLLGMTLPAPRKFFWTFIWNFAERS